ncbi:MAG: TetR/AcrR family transcriptional regulator [Chloroflexi bacterium CFX7]|nr:TetR/AcrR family transcriptional regulator [Chloroflexi bacterium CFX7]RIL04168.1 MAG: hypothetical protein DCC78_00855 [bacterium]
MVAMRQRAPKRPAAERKRLIIESAQSVFAASGYANAGTDEVARGAGVAPSAIYRYFPSKRHLYLATLRDAGPRLVALWREAAGRAGDPLETIWEIGLQYYDHVNTRSPFTHLWFTALGDTSDPEVQSIMASSYLAMIGVITGLLEDGQQRGLVRTDVDPRTAAWHFMSIGATFDLVHQLGLDSELDRPRVEAWGRLYIESLRKAPHGTAAASL